MNIFKIDQDQLRYIYESAEKRMEYHPDFADKYKDIIGKHPHFDNKTSALEAFNEMEKEDRMPQIWAKIDRDEEFFRIQNYYIVTDNIMVLIACEYIGFAQLLC